MDEIKGLSVLILEDSESDLMILKQMLIENGFNPKKIGWVSSIADFNYSDEAFILCDLNVEDSQGIATLKSVMDIVPKIGTSVIAFTGEDDEGIAQEAIHLGVQDYLIKGSFSKAFLRKTLLFAHERTKLLQDLYRQEKRTREAEHSLEEEAMRGKKFQLQLLSSQLNPHFIFNAMSSIQHSVLLTNVEDTLAFISKFSSLMRQVLENSRRELIPWSDEELFLTTYLDIERFRFENSFDYHFEVEDDLDSELLQIPPMMIQPYLENTVVHGIGNLKERRGKIEVILRQVDGHAVVTITDNGIGRVNAIKLRSLRVGKKHVSRAMHINEQRVSLLNDVYHTELFEVNVSDLMTNGQPSGTRVDLFIPTSILS
ncbi:MAG: histidine kinase [Cryomorphaceae bacterium]